jgi:hypothetical protein
LLVMDLIDGELVNGEYDNDVLVSLFLYTPGKTAFEGGTFELTAEPDYQGDWQNEYIGYVVVVEVGKAAYLPLSGTIDVSGNLPELTIDLDLKMYGITGNSVRVRANYSGDLIDLNSI